MNRDLAKDFVASRGHDPHGPHTVLLGPNRALAAYFWEPQTTFAVEVLHAGKDAVEVKVAEYPHISRELLVAAIRQHRVGWRVARDNLGLPTEEDDRTVAAPDPGCATSLRLIPL